MSLNAAMAVPSGHFIISRKKPSVIAQAHVISVFLKNTGSNELLRWITNAIEPCFLHIEKRYTDESYRF
jgi:hypothetical protein